MKVLPLHDIPPVRKPKGRSKFTLQYEPQSPSLDYASPRVRKLKLFRGPTLLEIVMVSFLLLIGAAVLLPRMVSRGDSTGRPAVTRSDLAALEGAIDQFQADTGRLPTNAEGLGALLAAPQNVSGWHGPYIMHAAKDVWGHSYIYRQLASGNFEIRSAGADGKPGTSDDIVSTCMPPQ